MNLKMNQTEWNTFHRRYIKRRMFHLGSKKIFSMLRFKWLAKLYTYIELFFLRRLVFPAAEYIVTTRCNLRCRDCFNYIPYISPENQYTVTLNDFKKDISNFLCGVNGINMLGIIGGEPLLNKELPSIVEYACGKKQIKHVVIVTNGTIMVSPELLTVLKKYRHKSSVAISNYSANKELEKILKGKEIQKFLLEHDVHCHLDENLIWVKAKKFQDMKLSDSELRAVFNSCSNFCYSIFHSQLHVCPRSSAFAAMKLYEPKPSDYVDLTTPCTQQNFIDFLKNDLWTACNFCPINTEKEKVQPAIQCPVAPYLLKEEDSQQLGC
ncbi:MAG: radical SAM protein [Lentisphaerae bacterium]|jgi:organic radical activating enzyme|nr:radical SAM protein [Lentisphaerota bacterium]